MTVNLWVCLLIFSIIANEHVLSQNYIPQALNKYKISGGYGGGGVKTSFTKTKTKTSYGGTKSLPVGGGMSYSIGGGLGHGIGAGLTFNGGASPYASGAANHYSAPGGGSTFTSGGCTGLPPNPMNGGLTCSQYSGCKANCMPNYQFPNGQTQITIKCVNQKWVVDGGQFDTVPSCEPICLPACMNNGICTAPNQCNCPVNFSGPQCQFEKKPCLALPNLPQNSRRKCSDNTCTVTCMEGHKFPDGSSIAKLTCKDGLWLPSKSTWITIPDCQATCNPPCLNGGNCLSFNVCQCPQDFRGPQCQYSRDVCDPKRLQFNGAYNCSGAMDHFQCSLSCPEGIPFSSPPAPVYTCYYSQGIFEPSPVPQCLYPENMQVIQGPSSSHTYYSQTSNSSGFNLNSLSLNGKKIMTKTKYDHAKPDPLFNDTNFQFVPLGEVSTKVDQLMTLEQKLPKPGTCFTWGGAHYKTFDGRILSFNSPCAHVLARDSVDNTFSIITHNHKNCATDPNMCSRVIKVYLQDKEYVLKKSDKGVPTFSLGKRLLPIPGQLPGVRVEVEAHYVVMSLDTVGAKIRWDGELLVQVETTESLWNRTEGLCGNKDGNSNNDVATKEGIIPKSALTAVSSWKVDNLQDICNDEPRDTHACKSVKGVEYQATAFCKNILSDPRFHLCSNYLDIAHLLETCTWDYCSCKKQDKSECACETLNVYIKECIFSGVKGLANWRDDKTCPMKCTGGRIYKSCGSPTGQPVCGGVSVLLGINDGCVEGCYCPDGTVLHEGKCISAEECPCRLRGKFFTPGASVPKDCNTCTCSEGKWVCTQVSCGARCSAVGDPHYTTFDGKSYDFMGQCNYYLVKHNNFTIEAENVACAGSISQAMNFPISVSSGLPSCTKTVTIRINGQNIKLKQNHDIVINGQDITRIPYEIAGVKIRAVSSIFIKVELPNKVEVWWDGATRVYIDAPPSLQGFTKGLCGTFNNNQKDDFLTPEDDVEQTVVPFANKWKTQEKCNDVPESLLNNPCERNIHRKVEAEKHCQKIKSNLFGDCHFYVDPEQYYQNCLYDMCSCENKISNCLCPIVSSYAAECARNGIKIDWRNDVRECGIHCPGGQKYQVCGDSCTRTCQDIATQDECKEQCVEGCNCPKGETLDENGECIPIGECKCQFDGLEFQPGYKEIRPASTGPELCTCLNAKWSCKPATPEQLNDFPRAHDLKSKCNASLNMVFTTCEPVEPVTCKNMHNHELFSASVCHSGCRCKDGYVLDTKHKKCVKPEHCPCHHGGRSYKDKSIVQNDCNTCTCKGGKWECTERQCTAECSAWGDSHYKTFDGKHFDYQGQCDYVLAKGSMGLESFDVTIQNVPCGSLGTSCSKSISIRVNVGGDQESLTLTRDKPLPNSQTLKHLTLRHSGLFVIVEAVDLGVSINWDKGTRVYVKVSPKWKNKIKGLCGNYNDNDGDDFQTPSGGITEASATIFGDSWRLQSYCPEALEISNTCEERPDRRVYALKKCGILKSPIFAPCHSEVPLDHYFDKCVFDTCACDQGGDCECLCTALAAYAQACNNRGVPIKWRSQELCPMQCDERCSNYSPCISTCPLETCDNLLTQNKLTKSCSEDTCVEGCSFKLCPPGYVYSNSSHLECVPRSTCKPICLEENGVTYYEGDLIEEDDCHSCYCSRGKKVCTGQPCSTTLLPLTTSQMDQSVQCTPGWTEWINQDKPKFTKTKTKGRKKEHEPVPNSLLMNKLKGAKCSFSQMVNIECRTVGTHIHPKKTGLDVECSLEKGLICKGDKGRKCPDFEIRVFCECDYFEHPPPTTESPSACNMTKPNKEHPTDCHLFYECAPTDNGFELVEKSCGRDMMYNPRTMVCDWPAAVQLLKPNCTESKETIEDESEVSTHECPDGMVKEKCAIKCDNLCLYYEYVLKEQGLCQHDIKCEASCVSAEKRPECPDGMFWANNETCVSMFDCMCTASDGRPVKPGQVVEEDGCKQCQCIDNFYSCHKIQCAEEEESRAELPEEEDAHQKQEVGSLEYVKETHVEVVTVPPVIIIPTTVTPPEQCDEDHYINLIQGDQPLPDEAFTASSVLGPSFAPWNGRLNSHVTESSGGNWAPEFTNQDQYLEIDLGRLEPIYGVIVKGSPLYDEYVTSYRVLYSPDGHDFFYVLNNEKHPQSFRGSIDQKTPVKQIFDVPFEAKKIRINPQTWNNGISLRVEIIGCGEPTTTPTEPYEVFDVKPQQINKQQCDDEMGLGDGKMSDRQISISSELSREFSKQNLKITGNKSWQPLSNSPTEWILFDFLEPREITGLVTRGGENGWVKTYTLQYSQNKKDWNPILDYNQKEKIFLANVDNNSPHKNDFDLPISARYFKIIPATWSENIAMRIELHGCFKPYPEILEPLTTQAPSICNICPGTTELELGACKCSDPLWWDGENCVNRTQCPCWVGHIPYSIGALFEEEDCSQCICKLGGITHCTPKKCPPCSNGLRSTVTGTCACACKPCPEGTILCPTSNICINSTLWCNGIQDCPDDEVECTTMAPETTTPFVPTTTTKKPKTCPIVDCHPGFKKVEKSPHKNVYLSPMLATQGSSPRKTFFKGYYKGVKTGGVKGRYRKPNLLRPTQPPPIQNDEEIVCKEYKCVSTKLPPKFIHTKEECPPVICQPNYMPVFDFDQTDYKECPQYSCHPPPPPDAICNITGRTFNTFDDVEYKYDICNHVIARDLENDEWDISLKKNCTTHCSRDLIIRHKDNHLIIHPDLTVELDGYLYNRDQLKKIAPKLTEFNIQQLGNVMSFESNRYGFWLIWNKYGNIKLGVVYKLKDKVDGLCGFFNEIPEDDKRKPDGTPARTTVDFGDSWALASDQPQICEAKTCPIHIQNKAWEICNKVKDYTLAACAKVVDIEAFVSRCLESTCTCLQQSEKNHTAQEECRCQTMQNFVTDCLQSDSSIELTDWRMQHDCPVTCESPLVYHDCYQRKCEPTCKSISDPNACPKVPNICFPGCYCPSGYVRKENKCIKPSSCRDCECNVLPHLQYVTYDESNFTVTGNCVYVMSRDVLINENKHAFQVLITNHPCQNNNEKMCVGKVTILYKGHKIHVLMDYYRNKLKLIVDAERIEDFSEVADWINIRETATKHFKLLLTEIQVEVSVYFPSLGVSVKAPSHRYGGKLEGLCGNCNEDPEDDFKTPSGKEAQDENDLALSWLYEHLPGGQSREQCENKPKEDCPPIPIDSDPCVQLVDINKFGQCLPVYDPNLFIDWCRKDTCGGHPELSCNAIEAYARDCASAGFCINWRTDLCPAKSCPEGQIYDPCGTVCPETCESIKNPKAKKTCSGIPSEGCYCPEGKVLLNDTCVEPKDCEVCDNEGHHPGDIWKKDKCTTCTCEGTNLKCDTQNCIGSDTICQRGYTAIKIPSKEDECCDKYACVPEPTAGPTCETPQKIQCGPGQILKLDTKPNGCQVFVCECKPKDECEPVDMSTEEPLDDGYLKEVDDSGCCPVVNTVCRPEICPDPKPCPQYHSLNTKEIDGRCCPLHTCEPPKDKCIFETGYIAATKGGERVLTKYEKQKLLKPGNSTWNDGPCRTCKCLLSSVGNYQYTCDKTDCESLENHVDYSEFHLEYEDVYDECCPKIKRVACKHKGKTYKVGEEWVLGVDKCTKIKCVAVTNGIQKETHKTTCETDCDLGFEYVPPPATSDECCGTCKPVGCVVGGVLHKIGQEWTSKDFCTEYKCKDVNGSMQVQSVLVNCPELSDDTKENFVVEFEPVEGECCKKHKITACKVGDSIYKVGEVWPSPDGDKCKKFTCIEKSNGDLLKQVSVESCSKDCDKGWEYEDLPDSCCGKCRQSACIVENELKKPGESWMSADNCTTYACERINDQFLVSSTKVVCPDISSCPDENIYIKGCCKYCNLTAESQTLCAPMALPLNKTIGIIKHGKCINKYEIKDFTECVGSCKSSTLFNYMTGMHESVCSCCQATDYKTLEIDLDCENGSVFKKKVAVPSKCGCEGCAKSSLLSHVKTKTKTPIKI